MRLSARLAAAERIVAAKIRKAINWDYQGGGYYLIQSPEGSAGMASILKEALGEADAVAMLADNPHMLIRWPSPPDRGDYCWVPDGVPLRDADLTRKAP